VLAWKPAAGPGRRPTFIAALAAWLDERWAAGDRRLLLIVFRDAGKSTLVGLFCAWLLGQDPNLRVLVLFRRKSGLATKMTRNVRRFARAEIRSPAISYPGAAREWARRASSRSGATRHNRDPSLLARSIGANITGCRADILICDDVEGPRIRRGDARRRREELRRAACARPRSC